MASLSLLFSNSLDSTLCQLISQTLKVHCSIFLNVCFRRLISTNETDISELWMSWENGSFLRSRPWKQYGCSLFFIFLHSVQMILSQWKYSTIITGWFIYMTDPKESQRVIFFLWGDICLGEIELGSVCSWRVWCIGDENLSHPLITPSQRRACEYVANVLVGSANAVELNFTDTLRLILVICLDFQAC